MKAISFVVGAFALIIVVWTLSFATTIILTIGINNGLGLIRASLAIAFAAIITLAYTTFVGFNFLIDRVYSLQRKLDEHSHEEEE